MPLRSREEQSWAEALALRIGESGGGCHCGLVTRLQVCGGASLARCSFSVRSVSIYFRIFSTIQGGRTKDFSSSNFRSRHPLQQILGRKAEAQVLVQAMPRGYCQVGVDGVMTSDLLVLPVVIAGSKVPNILLDEEVGLGRSKGQ